MRIAFIADGRAEHARRWISACWRPGDEFLLLSTLPCVELSEARRVNLPGLFRPGDVLLKSSETAASAASASVKLDWKSRAAVWLIRNGVYGWLEPTWSQCKIIDVFRQTRAARAEIRAFQPDVVHAFRTQNEGYIAARCQFRPWILSIWGSDFVHFARKYPLHRLFTSRAIARADAITADCQRDLDIAKRYLPFGRPTAYFPGNGGLNVEIYTSGVGANERRRTVVYARGVGPYLRPATLFSAFATLRKRREFADVTLEVVSLPTQHDHFRSLAMNHGIPLHAVNLHAYMDQANWSQLLRTAVTFVSPSTSDGTPNSMLEAMACGAIPIMGDIESVREWIDHGENGLLFDPDDPAALLHCLEEVFAGRFNVQNAQERNQQLMRQRVARDVVVPRVREFYQRVIDSARETDGR